MSTVVFFLAILSIQLIYSLMIADVDEKTYQYGMLRALGFHKNGLISLISL
jgi:ABC-type antimicrobial peptide transport system permease subunit